MYRILKNTQHSPIYSPMNFSGKLTCKIVQKTDRIRKDGTGPIYAQVFLNGEKKMFPVHVSVVPGDFDKLKQRVKKSNPLYKDYNMIIEKMLGDINTIEINYRLGNVALNIEKLELELKHPSSRLDFVAFWDQEMERQKDMLKPGTYRQQMTMLQKLKDYKGVVLFKDINEDFITGIKKHFKKKLRNQDNTIASFMKSFKKYLHIAEKRGIITPMPYEDIQVKSFKSDRTYLNAVELRNLNEFWHSEFISATHKVILAQFLFSCFTGLRFTDVQKLSPDNFIDNVLVFSAEKTAKLQRVTLSKSALQYVDPIQMFGANFTNEFINRELKIICRFRGITKKVSFHVARHTFATNFLISGGRVEHLQKLLGHSNVRETMVYVHIVESITDTQVHNMDNLLKTE